MPNDMKPEALLNKVLGKVTDVLINGDGTVLPKATDHYLAFMSPGIPLLDDDFNYALEGFGGVNRHNVDTADLPGSVGPKDATAPSTEASAAAMASDALAKYQRAEAFQAMCDLIPDTTGIVDSNRINVWNPESRVSSVYALALQMSQVYDIQPDEETKAKIERWRSLLQTEEQDIVDPETTTLVPSKLVKRYQEKQFEWLKAATEYQNLRVDALTATNQEAVHRFATTASIIEMKVRAAANDWATNGYRDEYDRIAAAIASVEGRSYALLKQRYVEDFTRGVLTNPSSGANFLYTSPAPASFARGGSGWTEFTFGSGDYQSANSFSSSTSSGGGGFSIFGIGVSGSGSVTRTKWEGTIDASNFTLTMKIARVPIYRPWFHLDFLKSQYWRFAQNDTVVKDQLISDGQSPPQGLMPSITTECVFVRDVRIHFGESHSDYMSKFETVRGGGGFSFGPWWAGGSHVNQSDSRTFDSTWSNEGISINGLQLLGFVCHTLPRSPEPSPEITDWI
ncbi:hypothetical protein [Myceligenerans pegani]|uniref:Uncharacterized protein n=1 Tax=Myceligenerans pegani TaxID=2776917 RepID=A0ABR9N0W8_9MICO|nr:hypothetical protein [Myceligenerans sp. TRM 65318]MBE1877302.1 hypothetical protein [Myceligenerans sp. TRM 65318]MBE3019573.1 hypothetical protein [Myceligenerans sp. TRM 65318]